ncbi:MAG TPA: pyridoxamine 5'-phosphate oxidase family protein [Nitrososphaerales archaeon]|nr:pyridoxamine 5'-phosphate oxidase family protein [Nitrososphaerales archaeon]
MVFQMPPLTESEMNTFLEKAPIARLCTHNSNGSIHAAPIWFKYDNGEILFGTQDDSHRIINLKKNPDVTIVVDTEALPYKGVVIYGKARLDYDNAIAKRVAIFEKYMPKANAEKLANGLAAMRKPVVIHVKPTKMISYDYGKDQTGLFS